VTAQYQRVVHQQSYLKEKMQFLATNLPTEIKLNSRPTTTIFDLFNRTTTVQESIQVRLGRGPNEELLAGI